MKIATLNIEGHTHLERVWSFLKSEAPEVICLQEIFRDTFDAICNEFGWQGVFAPMFGSELGPDRERGVAIVSMHPIELVAETLYDQYTEDYPEIAMNHPSRPLGKLLVARVADLNVPVATTHFTWTPDGQPSEQQRVNLQHLLAAAKGYPELLLMGDFNAPRGGEIYNTILERFEDGIPADIVTTLDPNLHKAKDLKLVVDGLFYTANMKIEGVRVLDGISDHCAIVGKVSSLS